MLETNRTNNIAWGKNQIFTLCVFIYTGNSGPTLLDLSLPNSPSEDLQKGLIDKQYISVRIWLLWYSYTCRVF